MSTLPIYHIDSNVLLPETRDKVSWSKQLMRYSNKKYIVRISIPALGECLLKMLTAEKFSNGLETISTLRGEGFLGFCTIHNCHRHIENIERTDKWLEKDYMDKLIISTAIEDCAKALVTSDNKLIQNSKLNDFLQRTHKMKILDIRNAPNFL